MFTSYYDPHRLHSVVQWSILWFVYIGTPVQIAPQSFELLGWFCVRWVFWSLSCLFATLKSLIDCCLFMITNDEYLIQCLERNNLSHSCDHHCSLLSDSKTILKCLHDAQNDKQNHISILPFYQCVSASIWTKEYTVSSTVFCYWIYYINFSSTKHPHTVQHSQTLISCVYTLRLTPKIDRRHELCFLYWNCRFIPTFWPSLGQRSSNTFRTVLVPNS